MKLWISIIAMSLAAPMAQAQTYPNFTSGSMTSTSNSTMNITENITTEVYGSDYKNWTGTNVSASGNINDPNTTYSINTPGEDWQLEIVERSAGSVISTTSIDRTIEQITTTTSLSVFSQ
jgi:hypothetical protein